MHSIRRTTAVAAASALLISAPLLAAAPAASAAVDGGVLINEVDIAQDWVELINTGAEPVDLSGYRIKDDKDDRLLAIADGTVLQPGAFLAIDTNLDGDPNGFGLGKADQARLFLPDGSTLLDGYAWTSEPATSYGRCADGLGDFVVQPVTSRGEPNVCAVDPADAVVVNEIESSGGTPGDWVELKSTASVDVDLAGLVLTDADPTHRYTLPAGSVLPAGGYLVLEEAAFGFGLGGADAVRLLTAGGDVVDEHSWTEHASTSYGRCADGVGAFATTASVTKGAANDCAPPASAGSLVINEVESNGDLTDWIELMNVGSTPIDLSGYVVRDNDPGRTDRVKDGTVIQPGALLVLDGGTDFSYGLGGADEVNILLPDGATVVASYAWTEHAAVTYGRCPDGTGEMVTTTIGTKGAPNDCSTPVRINEIESDGGEPGDWVELINAGTETVELGGLRFGDDDDTHRYELPASQLEPGALLVLEQADFGFGLGKADSARLLDADGTVLDEHSWTEHAATTLGRCPDGTGDFEVTAASSKGAPNACVGVLTPEAWPGGAEVRTLDEAGAYGKDLSGIVVEPSGTSAPGTLWAVRNGDGMLFRIVADGDGGWANDTADGWADGKTLAYPTGTAAPTATVDAEGVTVVDGSSAGGVYVASERDGSGASRPSVLRYDVEDAGTTLVAEQEWNLAADFPGLGANQGLEGVTWVPDSFLVAQGFATSTGALYDPAAYPGHGEGLFLVGVEGTAAVYAYALNADGTFARIATIETTFALVAEVQFDAERAGLWVVCDEACDGRIAFYEVDEQGAFTAQHVYDRPAGMANIANEGFAVSPQAECVDGRKATFYTDDNGTDGHALRTGSIDCAVIAEPEQPVDPEQPIDPQPPVGPVDPIAPGGPLAPSGPGASPQPVDGSALTDAVRGSVQAPAEIVAGTTVAIEVGVRYAGWTVDVWLHSTPRYLGSHVVDAQGFVHVALPADVEPGEHRIAVLAEDGTVLGWDAVSVRSAPSLARTGVEAWGAGALALALLALGGAIATARRVRGIRA